VTGAVYDLVTFSDNVNAITYMSAAPGRFIAVMDNGRIGYIDTDDFGSSAAWTEVTNGFNPLANILDVHYNDTDAVAIAVADNGQICRSTNGTN
jgi:hypothetical protein